MIPGWKTKTLDEVFECRGEWWIPGHEDHRQSGSVKFDDGITLTVQTPLLESDNAESTFREIIAIQSGRSSGDSWRNYPVLHGRVSRGVPCTLYSSFFTNEDDDHEQYVSELLFVGKNLRPLDEEEFHWGMLSLSNLENWLDHRRLDFSRSEDEPRRLSLTYSSFPRVDIPVTSRGFSLSIRDASSCKEATYSGSIRQKFKLVIKPQQPMAFKRFVEVFHKLQQLLTVLGGPVFHEESLEFRHSPDESSSTTERPDISAFYRRKFAAKSKRVDWNHFLFLYPMIKDEFSEIVGKWFDAPKSQQPARDLLMANEYHANQFVDVRFLGLMQAIECYSRSQDNGTYVDTEHYETIRTALANAIPEGTPDDLRQKLKQSFTYGNEWSLRKRMRSLIESLESETARLFCVNHRNFVDRVVDTRNYFTHYPASSDSNCLENDELFAANENLKTMLRILMLKAVGLAEETIRDRYHKNWYTKQHIRRYPGVGE